MKTGVKRPMKTRNIKKKDDEEREKKARGEKMEHYSYSTNSMRWKGLHLCSSSITGTLHLVKPNQ